MIHLVMFILFSLMSLVLFTSLVLIEPPKDSVTKFQIYLYLMMCPVIATQNAIYYFD